MNIEFSFKRAEYKGRHEGSAWFDVGHELLLEIRDTTGLSCKPYVPLILGQNNHNNIFNRGSGGKKNSLSLRKILRIGHSIYWEGQ